MSSTDNGAVRDDVLHAVGEGPAAGAIMVGNEQLEGAEGVKGPNPDQWADIDARSEPEGVETPEGFYKGPSQAEWGPVARAERGADPSDNPVAEETAEPTPVVVNDGVPPEG